jgi:hypothetical protein
MDKTLDFDLGVPININNLTPTQIFFIKLQNNTFLGIPTVIAWIVFKFVMR